MLISILFYRYVVTFKLFDIHSSDKALLFHIYLWSIKKMNNLSSNITDNKNKTVLHIFHSSETLFQNTQWDWRWLDPNLKFKKLKVTSEVMVAIHIPKSGKHHHYVTLFVTSVFRMLGKHKDCMSSLVHRWHWKTNSNWKHLCISYSNLMISSIFLKDLCPIFPGFYSWPWLWCSCFIWTY